MSSIDDDTRQTNAILLGVAVLRAAQSIHDDHRTGIESGDHDVKQRTALATIKIIRAVQAGADLRAKDAHGNTALHLCVRSSRAVAFLLARGMDPNARNDRRETPTHAAIACGNLESVKSMVAHDGDPLHLNDIGRPACHYAPDTPEGHAIVAFLKEHLEKQAREGGLARRFLQAARAGAARLAGRPPAPQPRVRKKTP